MSADTPPRTPPKANLLTVDRFTTWNFICTMAMANDDSRTRGQSYKATTYQVIAIKTTPRWLRSCIAITCLAGPCDVISSHVNSLSYELQTCSSWNAPMPSISLMYKANNPTCRRLYDWYSLLTPLPYSADHCCSADLQGQAGFHLGGSGGHSPPLARVLPPLGNLR